MAGVPQCGRGERTVRLYGLWQVRESGHSEEVSVLVSQVRLVVGLLLITDLLRSLNPKRCIGVRPAPAGVRLGFERMMNVDEFIVDMSCCPLSSRYPR
jgi:hypothetical protein